MPLIEIVTEPDIRSPQEAADFLKALRTVLLYTGVSDCRMNEGSMRCDVNLSLRRPGEALGVRTEMKNLNSFQSVIKAIEFEAERQAQVLMAGGVIHQETRRFDQATGQTHLMRRKENADDYRYFPDPDLQPLVISHEMIAELQSQLPLMPAQRAAAYCQWGLTPYQAEQLTGQYHVAEYFEQVCQGLEGQQIITAANLMLSEIFRLMPWEDCPIPLAPAHLGEICRMLASEEINSTTGKRAVAALWEEDQDPRAWVEKQGLYQLNDEEALAQAVKDALFENPQMVAGYLKGKANLAQALMGAAMKKTGGKGNPRKLQALVLTALNHCKSSPSNN